MYNVGVEYWLIIGYYDGVIFHRLVPDFIVQTGDPTGTGLGGESFYGEPFADEKHGRLRFNRYVPWRPSAARSEHLHETEICLKCKI